MAALISKTVLSSEVNFIGHIKVQTKSWNDAQTSENVQNLDLLWKNAFIVVMDEMLNMQKEEDRLRWLSK